MFSLNKTHFFQFFFLLFLTLPSLYFSPNKSNNFNREIASKINHREVLEQEIFNRLSRVQEFKNLKMWANKNGFKIYLKGNSAASWATYIKWDLQRRLGNKQFLPEQFQYQLAQIFHPFRKIELVIDGPNSGMKSVRDDLKLSDRFSITMLNSETNKERSTDSISSGLIEITGLNEIDNSFRFQDSINAFWADFINGQNTYFQIQGKAYSPAEEAFAAIHYLQNTFQFGLNPEYSSLKHIIPFLKAPMLRGESQREQFNHEIGILLSTALNLNELWSFLEQHDLLDSFKSFATTNRKFLERKPLPAIPMKMSDLKTAQELGLSEVTHSTRSADAYQSILFNHKRISNVFESQAISKEIEAIYGNGFYTIKGNKGLYDQFDIIFDLDPSAIEGRDFKIVGTNYVIILNRNAIIPSPKNYQRTLERILEMDTATFDRFGKSALTIFSNISPEELQWIQGQSELVKIRFIESASYQLNYAKEKICQSTRKSPHLEFSCFKLFNQKHQIDIEDLDKISVQVLEWLYTQKTFSNDPKINQVLYLKVIQQNPDFIEATHHKTNLIFCKQQINSPSSEKHLAACLKEILSQKKASISELESYAIQLKDEELIIQYGLHKTYNSLFTRIVENSQFPKVLTTLLASGPTPTERKTILKKLSNMNELLVAKAIIENFPLYMQSDDLKTIWHLAHAQYALTTGNPIGLSYLDTHPDWSQIIRTVAYLADHEKCNKIVEAYINSPTHWAIRPEIATLTNNNERISSHKLLKSSHAKSIESDIQNFMGKIASIFGETLSSTKDGFIQSCLKGMGKFFD